MSLRSIAVVLLALVVMASVLYLRRRPLPLGSRAEKEIDVVPVVPEPAPSVTAPSAPLPAVAELQPVLDRVFDGAVSVDGPTVPGFVSGDFDGDGATDLAVAVRLRREGIKPILHRGGERCRTEDAARPLSETSAPEPAEAAPGELLLAVVHGAEAEGWRSPDARRCRLVKNAVGSGMRSRPLAGLPDALRMRATRAHVGDVIEARRRGREGILLWTGAAFLWMDKEP